MHSDTTLLCSVQPGFLNMSVKIPFLSMLFLRKFCDKEKIFWHLLPCHVDMRIASCSYSLFSQSISPSINIQLMHVENLLENTLTINAKNCNETKFRLQHAHDYSMWHQRNLDSHQLCKVNQLQFSHAAANHQSRIMQLDKFPANNKDYVIL